MGKNVGKFINYSVGYGDIFLEMGGGRGGVGCRIVGW